jgi:hypothetical protein
MPKPERQQNVLDLLKELRGIEPLKRLFWSELNYQRVNQPLSRRGWTEPASKALADDAVLFAGGGDDNAFHVIYCRLASDALAWGFERPVVTSLHLLCVHVMQSPLVPRYTMESDGGGFEPPVPFGHTRSPGVHNQPLCHPSKVHARSVITLVPKSTTSTSRVMTGVANAGTNRRAAVGFRVKPCGCGQISVACSQSTLS